MKAKDFFELPDSLNTFSDYFDPEASPWSWIPQIKEALKAYFTDRTEAQPPAEIPPGLTIKGQIYIGPGVSLPPYGYIEGPAFIGPDCELRPGVYIRGNVIAGSRCVLGNSCEYKNSLLMDKVETAHFNYVGDSILGTKVHLGAGVILANVRQDRKNVRLRLPNGIHQTELRKLGAIIGENVEIGCNAVMNPGTLLGKGAAVLPTLFARGYIAPGEIVKKPMY